MLNDLTLYNNYTEYWQSKSTPPEPTSLKDLLYLTLAVCGMILLWWGVIVLVFCL